MVSKVISSHDVPLYRDLAAGSKLIREAHRALGADALLLSEFLYRYLGPLEECLDRLIKYSFYGSTDLISRIVFLRDDFENLMITVDLAARKKIIPTSRPVAPPPLPPRPSSVRTKPVVRSPVMERRSYPGFVGIKALKEKHAAELAYVRSVTENAKPGHQHWEYLAEHHGAGFDWWAFPIDYDTMQHKEFRVTKSDIAELLQDKEFMANYRAFVILYAKSIGFDLINRKRITGNPALKWRNYPIRLGKCLDSLQEFGQKDLHSAFVALIQAEGVDKYLPDRRFHKYLTPIH